MGLQPENKGIALVAIGGVLIVAGVMGEWATVNSIIVGMFALLKLD